MTNELTLENIRSGAFPSDAHAVGFLLGEIEGLTRDRDNYKTDYFRMHKMFMDLKYPDTVPAPEPEKEAVVTNEKVYEDGELWSFIRRCMAQGKDIHLDHAERTYEEYSARLDVAALERLPELQAYIVRAVVAARGSPEPCEQLPADERLAKATQALEYISEYCHGTEAHGIARSALVDIADLNAQGTYRNASSGGCTCLGCPVHGIPKHMGNAQGASRDASPPCPSVHDHMWAEDGHCMRCYAQRPGPADLVGALQDVVHTDPGPVRTGHAVKSIECPQCFGDKQIAMSDWTSRTCEYCGGTGRVIPTSK